MRGHGILSSVQVLIVTFNLENLDLGLRVGLMRPQFLRSPDERETTLLSYQEDQDPISQPAHIYIVPPRRYLLR